MMIFKHKHFTRGDKKKCLAMRSTVKMKNPPARSVVAPNASSSNRQQEYRDYRLPNPNPNLNAGDVVSNHVLQSNHHTYGGDHSILGNLVHGGSYNTLHGTANPGLSMDYRLSMQMQLPHSNYLNNGLNWTVPGLGYNRSDEVTHRPSVTASMAASFHANLGYNTTLTACQSIASIRNMEVNLAALIMNEDPTIDSWTALQLAKRRLNGESATGDLRRPR